MTSSTDIHDCVDKLFKSTTDNYIFVYTPPKVGSTTLVTSLRISLNKSYNIIHIHDEVMLGVLTGIEHVKINDILYYLSEKGKNVFVIDVYRPPVERKMSEFFEKLSPYHFNNSEENISKYSIERISKRFNQLFPHLENGDHTFDYYGIPESEIIPFDFEKKYTIQTFKNIQYIKLRLCDSVQWPTILSSIFSTDIVVITDYKTEDKGIGGLYKKFKAAYQMPSNYISLLQKDKYFNFYYNKEERNNYLSYWMSKVVNVEFDAFTNTEFAFYMRLCLENQYINDMQLEHYIDNGCFCVHCTKKRRDIYFRAKAGEKEFEKIIHNEVVNNVRKETISARIQQFFKAKQSNSKFTSNQFAIKLSNK